MNSDVLVTRVEPRIPPSW